MPLLYLFQDAKFGDIYNMKYESLKRLYGYKDKIVLYCDTCKQYCKQYVHLFTICLHL